MTAHTWTAALALALALPATAAETSAQTTIPITTRSDEARALYLKGRAAGEQLRAAESRALHARAIAKDPDFALAHLALAGASSSARGFFDELRRAVALADRVSEGERHLILATDAGVRGDVPGQQAHLTALVEGFPNDPRARMALGALRFGQQDFAGAVEQFEKAIALDSKFTLPYNQLGYAERFRGRLQAAEQAFQRYIALVPGEPNPYDSYAELLMKMGRFDESIPQYRRALGLDRHFISAWIGIATDQLLLGRPAEARKTLGELGKLARDTGERRQALLWTMATWLHEGDGGHALAVSKQLEQLAQADRDPTTVAADRVQRAQILLETGRSGAEPELARAVEVVERAPVREEVKENVRRNRLYFEALAALARKDLAAAAAKADAFRVKVEPLGIPLEVRRVHELAGRLALARGDAAAAVTELEQAGARDPVVLALQARALEARGDKQTANERWRQVADFDEVSFNWAFVRAEARERVKKPGT